MTQGVDLSYCQMKVNYAQLKKDGYTFAIIRAGYGNALAYPQQIDSMFEIHYKGCKSAGLNVGAYWYSYAMSPAEAEQEAKGFINALKGKQFEYPVYLDIEERRQFCTGIDNCSAIVDKFCETLKAAGYYVGVYCSTYWYTNYVSESIRKKWPCWIADYATKCSYKGPYDIWQNGLVYVAGAGNIDHDFCYTDLPAVVKAGGYNGFPKTPMTTKKTNEQIAQEVIQGRWGAGEDRRKRLTAAGYDYVTVQNIVNKRMNVQKAPVIKKKTNEQIAQEVIQGKWSAGAKRMRLLTEAGYDYMTIQNIVNKMLRK